LNLIFKIVSVLRLTYVLRQEKDVQEFNNTYPNKVNMLEIFPVQNNFMSDISKESPLLNFELIVLGRIIIIDVLRKTMNKSSLFLLFLNVLFFAAQSSAQDSAIARKKYITHPLNGSITLDGILDEAAWNTIDGGGRFYSISAKRGKTTIATSLRKLLLKFPFVFLSCCFSEPFYLFID